LGGEDAQSAIEWLNLAPANSRILVSAWDSDEEDAHLVGQTLDITDIVRYASYDLLVRAWFYYGAGILTGCIGG